MAHWVLIATENLHNIVENIGNRNPAHTEKSLHLLASSRNNIDIHLLFCTAHRGQPWPLVVQTTPHTTDRVSVRHHTPSSWYYPGDWKDAWEHMQINVSADTNLAQVFHKKHHPSQWASVCGWLMWFSVTETMVFHLTQSALAPCSPSWPHEPEHCWWSPSPHPWAPPLGGRQTCSSST